MITFKEYAERLKPNFSSVEHLLERNDLIELEYPRLTKWQRFSARIRSTIAEKLHQLADWIW